MRRPQTSPAALRLAHARDSRYVSAINQSRFIMFSRIFRRREDFRRLRSELARMLAGARDRRVAGILIAYFHR